MVAVRQCFHGKYVRHHQHGVKALVWHANISQKFHGKVIIQVDAKALGLHDYHQVTRRPMDLGTIKKNLMADTAGYSSSAEVLKDVQQVWANCRNYNDEDDPIMYVCAYHALSCGKHYWCCGKYERLVSTMAMAYRKVLDSVRYSRPFKHCLIHGRMCFAAVTASTCVSIFCMCIHSPAKTPARLGESVCHIPHSVDS